MSTDQQSILTHHVGLLGGIGVFLFSLIVYISTLAPGLVFGDPAEYTFVPYIWGIAHPPGYAFQTILGGLWQRLIPFGSIAWRANLLSAFAGAGIATLVYGSVRALGRRLTGLAGMLPGLLAGMSAATATDMWQHSIHANSHIVSALLATASLFLLLRWWASGQGRSPDPRWLYGFSLVAGLSVTHHPLLVFSFPAYAVFLIAVHPRVLVEWRTLLLMLGFALLGLSIWLYFPLRASLPSPILFGPTNTNTLDGFLNLVLARGLRVNLFHFGWGDQADRLIVFWSLLKLQAAIPLIALMAAGTAWLWVRNWRVGMLYSLFIVVNLAFILNSIQDVMAYLMVPFSALLSLIGVGLIALMELLQRLPARSVRRMQNGLGALLLVLPVLRGALLAPRISLHDFREAERWVDEVYSTFEHGGEGAILLAHWEHLTPLWYAQWVEQHPLDPADVTLVFVASGTANPWLENVEQYIKQSPLYVSGYQRSLADAGYRLRPVGEMLYRVLPAPALEPQNMGVAINRQAGPVEVVGVDLLRTEVAPGERIPLSIAFHALQQTDAIYFPYVMLGDATMLYTTDSHVLSPNWIAGEVIVERYDLRAPLDASPGEYSLRMGIRNLSTGEDVRFSGGASLLELGTIVVTGAIPGGRAALDSVMADIGHQIALVGAAASGNGQRAEAVWQQPLSVHPGDVISLRLTWQALNSPDDNWKVFVHLINGAGQVIAQRDYPPLGGAFPTYLWFPKWVAGQEVRDPYQLVVPVDAAPGEYYIAVGLYGFNTSQRLHFFDRQGNLSGDFFILGSVLVQP